MSDRNRNSFLTFFKGLFRQRPNRISPSSASRTRIIRPNARSSYAVQETTRGSPNAPTRQPIQVSQDSGPSLLVVQGPLNVPPPQRIKQVSPPKRIIQVSPAQESLNSDSSQRPSLTGAIQSPRLRRDPLVYSSQRPSGTTPTTFSLSSRHRQNQTRASFHSQQLYYAQRISQQCARENPHIR